jgi:hypothetical protein
MPRGKKSGVCYKNDKICVSVTADGGLFVQSAVGPEVYIRIIPASDGLVVTAAEAELVPGEYNRLPCFLVRSK